MATNLYYQGLIQELYIMERVTQLTQRSGQPPYCVFLRSHFIHTGKPGDGDHLCLVMNALVGDIEALQTESKAFPVPLAKLILRDTLSGLTQLHSSGVVHTGLCSPLVDLIMSNTDALYRPQSSQHHVQFAGSYFRGQIARTSCSRSFPPTPFRAKLGLPCRGGRLSALATTVLGSGPLCVIYDIRLRKW